LYAEARPWPHYRQNGLKKSKISKRHDFSTQSGAGIVIDSVPDKEYQETEDKSHAILSALKAFEKNRYQDLN